MNEGENAWMSEKLKGWEKGGMEERMNEWMDERILSLGLKGCHVQLSVTCNIQDYTGGYLYISNKQGKHIQFGEWGIYLLLQLFMRFILGVLYSTVNSIGVFYCLKGVTIY